jgi:hypothetical protein
MDGDTMDSEGLLLQTPADYGIDVCWLETFVSPAPINT